jgi:hypothetical protein
MTYGQTKTCNYCRGNHAILDCQRLQTEAKSAEDMLATWDTDGIRNLQQSMIYSQLYRFERNEVSTHDGISTRHEFNKYVKIGEDHPIFQSQMERLHHELTTIYKSDGHFAEHSGVVYTNDYPEELSISEHQRLTSMGRYRTRRHLVNLVRRNDEVQAKIKARSAKACSYCRESGHTVRTCTSHKGDIANHHLAFKITTYRTAQALSRFGIWTGAMALHEDKPPMMCFADSYSPVTTSYDITNMTTGMFRSEHGEYHQQTTSQYCESKGITIEDIEDYWFVKSALEQGLRFHPIDRDPQMSPHSSRGSLRIGLNDIARLSFAEDCLEPKSLQEKLKTSILKSSVTAEHIYQMLVVKYKLPRKGDKWHAYNRITAVHTIPSESYLSSAELFDKKKRVPSTWQMMEKFIKNNQDIVNKVNSLSV